MVRGHDGITKANVIDVVLGREQAGFSKPRPFMTTASSCY